MEIREKIKISGHIINNMIEYKEYLENFSNECAYTDSCLQNALEDIKKIIE